ncbi:MAG: insulinase family protein [Bacteroidales bacterium]|nr:insulinase family protein [Bacteroidales bacterium]
MKKTIWILLLTVVFSGISFAQLPGGNKEKKSDLTSQVPLDKKVIYGKLDNGFTYYIRNNKKPENMIQYRLVTNAGSIMERDDQQGLAHFCEHMAFNGIKGYPHNSMIQKLQEHGVEFGRDINAYTSFDQTVYYVNMPSNDPEMVKMGMEILDGWAGNILFDQKEIESERGVIHEEWRGGVGHGDRLRKKTWPIMLKGSRYADRLPIGKEEVIMNFERQSIVDFFNDWYRPDLQAIVIVGDMDNFEYNGIKGAKGMEQQVKDVFSSHQFLGKQKLARESYEIPDNKEPLICIATDKEATSVDLEIFWKHKKTPNGTVGAYRLMIVRNLISMMINERFSEICEKPSAPMMYAGGGYGGFLGREIDVFEVNASPKEGRINETAELLLKVMKQIDDHGFLQAELDRQKEDLLARYAKMAKEANKTQTNSLANEYTNHYLDNEPCPGIVQEWKYAKEFAPEITLEECNALVKTWITDENLIFYLTAPEKDGFVVPTEKEALDIINNSKKVVTEPWVDNFKDEPLFSEEVADVTPIQTASNSVLGYTEYTCPNGVKFVVKKTELKADEILINSYSFGGTSLYGDADCYQAENADGFIDAGGIANFSATQLSKKLKGMNLSISPSIGGNTQGFTGNCSPKDLETTLQLINLYYTAPRKDQEAYERQIENTVQQVKFVRENPQVAFIETYYKTAYPNDKRQVVIPSEEKVRSLNLDRMYEIYKERFAFANNQIFFFVGNVSDNDIALIAKYLNHLPTIQAVTKDYCIDRSPKFANGIVHNEAVKGIEKQGMLLLSGQMDVPNEELDAQTRIALQQLGDALGITTLEIIREKNGDAYSPSASVNCNISLTGTGKVAWQFYIGCDPEKAKKIEKDCIKILKQYIKKGCDEKTLGKVQEQMIVQHAKNAQNNSFWMGQLQGCYMYNESRDFHVSDYDQMVKSVTPETIKALAQKYINLNNYVVVTLRPEDGAVGTAD